MANQNTPYLIDGVFTFVESDWFTPNTYSTNFRTPPKSGGVYLILKFKLNGIMEPITYTVLYVGSSKNLNTRYHKHEVFRVLKESIGSVVFYFKEEENYLAVEKQLIKTIQPKYNKQHK